MSHPLDPPTLATSAHELPAALERLHARTGRRQLLRYGAVALVFVVALAALTGALSLVQSHGETWLSTYLPVYSLAALTAVAGCAAWAWRLYQTTPSERAVAFALAVARALRPLGGAAVQLWLPGAAARTAEVESGVPSKVDRTKVWRSCRWIELRCALAPGVELTFTRTDRELEDATSTTQGRVTRIETKTTRRVIDEVWLRSAPGRLPALEALGPDARAHLGLPPWVQVAEFKNEPGSLGLKVYAPVAWVLPGRDGSNGPEFAASLLEVAARFAGPDIGRVDPNAARAPVPDALIP